MDETANVVDASVFVQLSKAINEYIDGCHHSIDQARFFMLQQDNALEEVNNLLLQRLKDAEQWRMNADIALRVCQQRVEYDDEGRRVTPNCGCEKRDLRDAVEALKVAQRNKDTMDGILRYAEQLKEKFHDHEAHLKNLADQILPDASDWMLRCRQIVDEYQKLSI
ncbi:MAG: hypothetical protein MJZ32_10625 [Bacteroidaceae bacterium]|nr:hypothetical protein [Bacteroidaceae bacterium]